MMELLIVRHGTAEDSAAGGDSARSLTEKGKREADEAARGLAKVVQPPQLILTSAKVRAQQTAELFGQAFAVDPELLGVLADGQPEDVREALGDREENRLMIVGHEPTFSHLISLLTHGHMPSECGVKMKKAGCAMVDLPIHSGRITGLGELQWLVPPKVLRALA